MTDTLVHSKLLTHLRDWIAPAQPAVTTSEEHFKETGVSWSGYKFQNQFLGREVEATEVTTLAVSRLERASLDAPILVELDERAETAVSQFWAFLVANKESTGWFAFYLRGKDGNLWAVEASWNFGDNGWDVDADSVDNPFGWNAGDQVVSCK